MRNKKSNPAAIIIFCLYFVTIFGYGLSLLIHFKKGPERVKASEKEIIKVINSTLKNSQPGTKEFADKLSSSKDLRKYTDTASDLYAMTLSVNGNVIFSFPSDIQYDDFTVTSPLIVPKHDTLYSQDGSPLKYNAAYYYLSPQTIFANGRIAFFALLVLTFITAIFLIIAYVKDPSKEDPNTYSPFEEDSFDVNKEIEENTLASSEHKKEHLVGLYKDKRPSRDELFPTPDFSSKKTSALPEEKSNTTIVFTDEDIGSNTQSEETVVYSETEQNLDNFNSKTDEKDLYSEYSSYPEPHPEAEIEAEDILFLTPENAILPGESESIYSDTTGFGKEQYMISQLNSELVEVSAEEEDLTVFLIRIPGVNRQSAATAQICEFLRQMDGAQDFIFEYKDDGYAIIMPTVEINEALNISNNIHRGIASILYTNGYEGLCFIGISSKSVRIITGERLVKEAEQALLHAQDDVNSPVIAFRVNPEKYREYIAKEAQKAQRNL